MSKQPKAKAASKTSKQALTSQEKPTTDKASTKSNKYRSFKLQKRVKPKMVDPPGSFKVLAQAFWLLKSEWKLFLGIVGIYTLLSLLLVQSFFGVDLSSAKETLDATTKTGWGVLGNGFSLLGQLAIDAGVAKGVADAYRLVLGLVMSLAIIWALRHIIAGNKVGIRDAFYEGMYPFVPFVLIFVVISLQLIPVAIGTYLFSVVGATSGLEIAFWAILLAGLSLLTLYMLSSSVFALYIACLPGMYPMAALKSARQLVRYRRWAVMRRLLFLPLVLFVIMAIILVPIIIFATPAAVWVFFVLLMIGLPFIHSYMYSLYRGLLHEEK